MGKAACRPFPLQLGTPWRPLERHGCPVVGHLRSHWPKPPNHSAAHSNQKNKLCKEQPIHLHRNWHLKHSPTWALVSLFSCRISKLDLPRGNFPRRWDHGLFHRPRTKAKRALRLDLVNCPNITAEIPIDNVRSLSVRCLVLARHISNPLFQNPDRPCFPTTALERANFRMNTCR